MSHTAHSPVKQTLEPVSTAPAAAAAGFAPVEPAAPDPQPAAQPPADRRQNKDFSGVDERKNVVDRRTGLDRRFVDIGSPTGLERRRGPGRRLNENRKSAEEGEMTDEQFEFLMAIDTYKKINHRAFPTWTEVLEVVKQLGYRKVAASTIKLPNSNGRPTSVQE